MPLARIRQNRRVDTVEQITDRQLEVARLIAEGRSNPEIADALGVSLAGAKYHVSELLGRLGVTSREDVAAWYRRREGVPARRGWRERARMLVPVGAILGALAGAAIVSVALSGGRDDSGLPVSAVTETATAAPTEPVGDDAVGGTDPADACVELTTRTPGQWPTALGLLWPSYYPPEWKTYETAYDATPECEVTSVEITIALPGAGPVEGWIYFTQYFEGAPALEFETDEPIALGNGITAYRSIESDSERLAWEQDGVVAVLLSPSESSAELVRIASSAMVTDASVLAGLHTEKMPLFWGYVIQSDDSVASIAQRFGVTEETLIWNNMDMDALLAEGSPSSFVQILPPGSRIRVPPVDGILHVAQPGETVASIAATYHAEERDIIEFAANGLDGDPARLEAGALILVPGGTKEFPPPP